jgi:hypothetical protein
MNILPGTVVCPRAGSRIAGGRNAAIIAAVTPLSINCRAPTSGLNITAGRLLYCARLSRRVAREEKVFI